MTRAGGSSLSSAESVLLGTCGCQKTCRRDLSDFLFRTNIPPADSALILTSCEVVEPKAHHTMNETVLGYTLYLALAISMTAWVARTLHRNGRPFLVQCFQGDTKLADSVNHLLVFGFYLVNLGFASLHLKTAEEVFGTWEMIEMLSSKIGFMLLCLGGMHFFNLYLFTRLRKLAGLPRLRPPTAAVKRTHPSANVLDTL